MADNPGLTVTVRFDTRDLERLARKMDVLPAFKDGLLAAATMVKGIIAEYPPMTEANMPGPYPKTWYVRGHGPHWALKGGGFHSARTSQNLGRRWTVRSINDGLGAIVGNFADYAPYVQARDYQRPWHKAHGWKTAETVVEDETPDVMKTIKLFVDKALERK